MKVFCFLIALLATAPSLSFSQSTFASELKKIYGDIPIDSPFSKLIEYALNNDFSRYTDNMDSAHVSQFLISSKTRSVDNSGTRTSIRINYSNDSNAHETFFGKYVAIVLRRSYDIFDKNLEKDFSTWTKKFAVLSNRIDTLPINGFSDVAMGKEIRYYNEPVFELPNLVISYIRNSILGATITVSYLRSK